MLTVKAIKVASSDQARDAATYPESEIEKGFEAGVDPDAAHLVAAYYADVSPSPAPGSTPGPTPGHAHLHPETLEALGLKADEAMTPEGRANLLLGKSADGQRQLIPEDRGRKINGIDCVFSADKSISIAWANASPEQRALIEIAQSRAVAAGIAALEDTIGLVRRGGEANRRHEKIQLVYSVHNHYTARPAEDVVRDGIPRADCQVHTHVPIMTMAQCADGKFLTLDTLALAGETKYIGALYQSTMAAEMRKIGYEMEEVDGSARVVGICDELRDHFSSRTIGAKRNAAAWAKARGVEIDKLTPAERVKLVKEGAFATRLSKDKEQDARAHFDAWQAESAALGYKPPVLGKPIKKLTREEMLRDAVARAMPVLSDLLQRQAFIDGREVKLAAMRGLIAHSDLKTDDLREIMQRIEATDIEIRGRMTRIVGAAFDNPKTKTTQVLVTTQAQIDRENAIIEHAANIGRRHRRDARLAEQFYDPGRPPNAQQRAGIAALLEGNDLDLVVGAAGVGKTTLLTPVVSVYQDQGYRVLGAAIAWRTAGALAETGIEQRDTYAIETLLHSYDRGDLKFDRPTLLVLDEVSQIDSLRGERLVEIQRANPNLKIVCVGDELQANPVDAGSFLNLLTRSRPTAPVTLTETLRQKGREADIANAMRAPTEAGDRIEWAIRQKFDKGDLQYVPGGRDRTVQKVVEAFTRAGGFEKSQDDKPNAVVLALTNAETHDLNSALRAAARANGKLGPDIVRETGVDRAGEIFDLPLAVGDKIRLLNKAIGRDDSGRRRVAGYNGSILTVEGMEGNALALRTSNGNRYRVDINDLRGEDGHIRACHAYAITIDSFQGGTCRTAIPAFLNGTSLCPRNKWYVAMSRHTESCHALIDQEAEEIALRRKAAIGQRKTGPVPIDELLAFSTENVAEHELKSHAVDLTSRVGRGEGNILHEMAIATAILRANVRDTVSPARAQAAASRAQAKTIAEALKPTVLKTAEVAKTASDSVTEVARSVARSAPARATERATNDVFNSLWRLIDRIPSGAARARDRAAERALSAAQIARSLKNIGQAVADRGEIAPSIAAAHQRRAGLNAPSPFDRGHEFDR